MTNAAEILRALLEATLATSLATVLVLALRGPMRRLGGAGIAYALWGIVPAALLAGLLPAASQAPMPPPLRAFVIEVTPRALTADAVVTTDWTGLALWAWTLGVVIAAAALVRQQRTFERALGTLQLREDGMHQSRSVHGLPAVIGLWSPRIVVPCDFDRRYDMRERELMQAHERAHIAHGDLAINAAVALLRCLFWFNPLLPWAARAFRHDQELACDQRVIARHPQARRAYGQAMLKTQLAAQPLPVGCHWGFSHPLKERIAMLDKPLPTSRRLLAGATCVAVLALACGYAAWAAQPAVATDTVPAGQLRIDLVFSVDDGAEDSSRLLSAPGSPIRLHHEASGQTWDVVARATTAPDGMQQLDAVVTRDGKQVAAPRLKLQSGVPGRIRIGEEIAGAFKGVQIDATITDAAAPAADAAAPSPKRSEAAPVRTAEPTTGGVVDLPAPSYPRDALDRKLDGNVVLEIAIDPTGKVTAVSVASSDPAGVFDAAAVAAAWKWRFTPRTEDGKPVASRVQVPVRFEHDKQPEGSGGQARA